MANENDFLDFADGVGATVIDQAAYVAAAWRPTGFQAGIADPAQLNKVWRQGAAMANAIAKFIISEISQDVLDNGDTDALAAQIALAMQQTSTIKPVRVVTGSVDPVLTLTDYYVGFNRVAGVAATPVALPNGMQPGQSFELFDLKGNFNQFPITITPPAGTIAGKVNFVLNEDGGGGKVTYFGTNLYGAQQW